MKYSAEFTFTGAMKCSILFCTEGQYGCGCDTCKSWLKCETGVFVDQEGCTFGRINFEKSTETQVHDICSHHVMYMNLVPFEGENGRKMEELDIRVSGGDLGGTWTDTVMVDGHECTVKIRVFDSANPNTVTKVASKLQIDFRGGKKCKLAFTSLTGCGCEDCKWWSQWEKGTFADDPNIKYGVIHFENSPMTETYNLCPNYVIAMNLTSFDDEVARNAADLDVVISGNDIGGSWEDQVEIDGQTNAIKAKVYVVGTTSVSAQNSSSFAKKTRTLQFDFTGPKKCKMVFTVTRGCGCLTCRWWSKYETATFTDESERNYGVIFFESSPYTTTFDICSRHEMHMNLVPFDTDSNKAEDLDVVVTGDMIGRSYSDTVDIDGESNKVVVKVLKGRKAARTISASQQAYNKLEFEFTGDKKCRVLITPDPEGDCECEKCVWWQQYFTNSFTDDPSIKYTYIDFETSPSTQTFSLCSSSVMFMNLVPFDDTTDRNAADLDLQVYGSDIGCSWTDTVTIDGTENVVKIKIFTPPAPINTTTTAAATTAVAATATATVNNNNNNNNNNNHNNNSNRNNNSHHNNQNAAYQRALQFQTLRLREAQIQQARYQNYQAAWGFGQTIGEGIGAIVGNMMAQQ
ncbi:hypothetical protein BGW38_000678 [Lunasporangiospora selenospora]|uniref:Uncharacterized protein n=1 Tax=Lunasporangiospora selenospora TaxID=979761 RepID=A0A9P6FV53_9FUNG|nr:hypothetical protein BGW38_000678 [Lunasporangiospora selenospora]